MKIRTITSLQEFDGLAGVWRLLVEASGQTSPLLSHDWFAACWRTAGPNRLRELWIIEDSAGPLALIPLVRTDARYRGLPLRVVELMHPALVPLVDFPILRDVDDVMAAFVEALHRRGDWEVFLMRGLSSSSHTWKAFQAAAGDSLRWRIAQRTEVPCISLADPAFRRAVGALRQGLLNGGAYAIEEHRRLDGRSPLFEEVSSLIANGVPTSLHTMGRTAPDTAQRFLAELSTRATANDWLSLWVLRVDGTIAGTEYNIISDGCVRTIYRDVDDHRPGVRVSDAMTVGVTDGLSSRPGLHTYYRMPGEPKTGPLAAASGDEMLVVETFADTRYAALLRKVETRIVPFAHRLSGRRDGTCG